MNQQNSEWITVLIETNINRIINVDIENDFDNISYLVDFFLAKVELMVLTFAGVPFSC